jgi:lipoprotein
MNIKNILLGTLVSLAAVSCVYEDTSKHVISTDKAIYEIGKEGGEVVLMLTSPKDWTATIAPATSLDNVEGITVMPSSGKGSSKPVEVKIIAESNDGENYKRSALISFMADNISTAVNLVQEGGKERPADAVTIGEFLKKPVDAGVYYRLTGTVTGAKELGTDDYSNCTLVDETGSVLLYGVGLEKGGSTKVKTFEVKGVKNGDLLTVETTRGAYNGAPQGAGSYYISHEAGKFDEFEVKTASFSVVSSETSVSFDVKAGDNVEWTVTAAEGFMPTPTSGKGNGTVTVSFAANTGSSLNEGKVTVSTEANVQTKSYIVTIKQNAPEQDVTYTKVNAVTNGKSYLLVSTKNGESKAAMPLVGKNYGYLSSTSFTKKDEDIVMTNAECGFKFISVEGGYTIQQSDNKYLYGTSGYNTFNVSAEIPESGHVFSVEPQADATVKITCVATGKWLQYGEGEYTSFGLYDSEKGNQITLYEAK